MPSQLDARETVLSARYGKAHSNFDFPLRQWFHSGHGI
jgi:hypothetical protein